MITVGLDFGTHQTKVCIEERDGAVLNYTFMKFYKSTEESSYVLPSLIGIGKDDLLSYGFLPDEYNGHVVKYFKQSTFLPNSDALPNDESLYFSTWYLAFILFDLEKQYGRDFSIQMGAPTDNDKMHIQKVKRIATRLIASAYRLVEDIFANDKEKFLATPINELRTKTELVPYSQQIKDDYSLLVFPEAYACLQPLTTQGKIDKHMNLMIDIGGGTTDMSFFTIETSPSPLYDNNRGKPQVYYFYSLEKGLNYLTYAEKNNQIDNVINVQYESQIDSDRSLVYFGKIQKIVDGLLKELSNQFISQTGSKEIYRLLDVLKDRPLIYCGGGSCFRTLLRGYNGFSDIKQVSYTDWDIKAVKDIDEIIKLNLVPILSTAYGLAMSCTNDDIVMKPFEDIFDDIRGSGDFKHFSTRPVEKPYTDPDVDY